MAKSTARLGGEIVKIGLLLFFAIIWSGFTLTADYYMLVKAGFRQILALSYPTVIGTVTSSGVQSSDNGDSAPYRPLIKYIYVVDGKRYDGNRYRYDQVGTNDHYAHDIVASYPVGKEIEVRHSL